MQQKRATLRRSKVSKRFESEIRVSDTDDPGSAARVDHSLGPPIATPKWIDLDRALFKRIADVDRLARKTPSSPIEATLQSACAELDGLALVAYVLFGLTLGAKRSACWPIVGRVYEWATRLARDLEELSVRHRGNVAAFERALLSSTPWFALILHESLAPRLNEMRASFVIGGDAEAAEHVGSLVGHMERVLAVLRRSAGQPGDAGAG